MALGPLDRAALAAVAQRAAGRPLRPGRPPCDRALGGGQSILRGGAQHLLFLVYGVLLQVPEEGAEALALIERAETLFDPRWVCPFCSTGYHLAATTVCARAGQLARGHEFLKRAEHGAARWPGGPWPAAVARRDSCSTSAARVKRSGGSIERRSAPRKVSGRRAGDAAGMHTEHRIEAPGSMEPEALDDCVAKLHRDLAGEEPRPPAHPLCEARGYPPNCAHGRNSLTDRGYDLALARLTAEPQTPLHITSSERNHPCPHACIAD